MQLTGFIQNIEKEFEEVTPGTITGDTQFRTLDGWSSMMALILIAKIDSDYNVTVTAEDLAKCSTLSDLYTVVQGKAS